MGFVDGAEVDGEDSQPTLAIDMAAAIIKEGIWRRIDDSMPDASMTPVIAGGPSTDTAARFAPKGRLAEGRLFISRSEQFKEALHEHQ